MTQWDVLMGWQGHIGEVYAVEFSCDETTVFSAGEDGKVGPKPLYPAPSPRKYVLSSTYDPHPP